MKITCVLKRRVERKDFNPNVSYLGLYDTITAQDKVIKETFVLQIIVVKKNDYTSHVLSEIEVERGIKGKTYDICFDYFMYRYFSETDTIYCMTLTQKI